MFKCRHRSCGYVTLGYILDRKWWLSRGLSYKRLYSATILPVKIGDLSWVLLIGVVIIFHPAALNAVRSSSAKGVRLSVCVSVYASVCSSNAWIVTKGKKNLSRFLYHTKEHLA